MLVFGSMLFDHNNACLIVFPFYSLLQFVVVVIGVFAIAAKVTKTIISRVNLCIFFLLCSWKTYMNDRVKKKKKKEKERERGRPI